MNKICLAVVILAAAGLLPVAVTSADKAPATLKPITLTELRERNLLGQLMVPLGKLVTIEGVFADENYRKMKIDSGYTLMRVQTVDGKKLEKEAIFQLPQDKGKQGVGIAFSYFGYETGSFIGAPDKLFDHVNAFATTAYHFETEFQFITRK